MLCCGRNGGAPLRAGTDGRLFRRCVDHDIVQASRVDEDPVGHGGVRTVARRLHPNRQLVFAGECDGGHDIGGRSNTDGDLGCVDEGLDPRRDFIGEAVVGGGEYGTSDLRAKRGDICGGNRHG